MKCGKCEATGSDIVRNGHTTTTGKQKYKCMKCGYQFVENPAWKPVSNGNEKVDRTPVAGASFTCWYFKGCTGFIRLVTGLCQRVICTGAAPDYQHQKEGAAYFGM